MTLRRLAAGIATLTAATLLSARPGSANAAKDPMKDGVYVIGDSITFMMNNSALHPKGVDMDGFPGRRITALDQPYIAPTRDYWPAVEHAFTPTPTHRVRTVVIALGTNGADTDLTVDQAADLYRAGIAQIRATDIWKPGPQRIVLVTPYRAPRIDQGHTGPNGEPWRPYQWATKMGVYAAAMHHVAQTDDHVCLMPWRAAISRHPGWLLDGIHPNAKGRALWRDLLVRTVRACR